MRIITFVLLVNYLGIVAGANSTQEISGKQNLLGYELIEYRLENLEERMSNSLDRLVELISKNQQITEKKLFDLKANSDGKNYSLTDSLKRLETTVNINQKLIEEKSRDIKKDTSKLLERIVKLETLGETLTKNHKSLSDQNKKILDNQYAVQITSCKEPLVSGVFRMQNPNLKVYCEEETFDGGWLVIQQRFDGNTLRFNRTWTEYRAGFGTVAKDNDFWVGLEAVHQITKGGSCELAVEMKNSKLDYKYARYSRFKVAGEGEKYKLTAEDYSGTAEDGLNYHNSMKFSTFDSDNDADKYGNCALNSGGGWWFTNCDLCNLNRASGAMWPTRIRDDKLYYSRMMVRCG